MPLTAEERDLFESLPLRDLARVYYSARLDVPIADSTLRAAERRLEDINAIFRDRLRAEHGTRALPVDDLAYRATADGLGLELIPIVPADPPSTTRETTPP